MAEWRVRAIRGATTVERNDRDAILEATRELLLALSEKNELDLEEVVSAIFTVTHDLDAEFPAVAARGLGWNRVPLLCTQEIPVPGSLPRCIRVLIHCYTKWPKDRIQHLYLREAVKLRPDLACPQ